VVSGYALTFGLALVPAGRLGDRLGCKQMFLTGLTVFTLASVACGISRNPAELIVSRLVQGRFPVRKEHIHEGCRLA
jgi:MFS family permease